MLKLCSTVTGYLIICYWFWILVSLLCSNCSIETITLGDKRIGIKTSVLEEKATACNMLCCYADELKEGFFPWIDQVEYRLLNLSGYFFASF